MWTKSDGASQLIRGIIGLFMFLMLFQVLSWLQGRYDAADRRKAIALVKEYSAPGGKMTVSEAVIGAYPGVGTEDIKWSTEVLSSCLGHVRVIGQIDPPGAASSVYAFDVKLTAPSIHPTDSRTVQLLRSLTSTQSFERPSPRVQNE